MRKPNLLARLGISLLAGLLTFSGSRADQVRVRNLPQDNPDVGPTDFWFQHVPGGQEGRDGNDYDAEPPIFWDYYLEAVSKPFDDPLIVDSRDSNSLTPAGVDLKIADATGQYPKTRIEVGNDLVFELNYPQSGRRYIGRVFLSSLDTSNGQDFNWFGEITDNLRVETPGLNTNLGRHYGRVDIYSAHPITTSIAGGGGTITPLGESLAIHQSTNSVSGVASNGYHIAGITVNGQQIPVGPGVSSTNLEVIANQPKDIMFTFEANQPSVTSNGVPHTWFESFGIPVDDNGDSDQDGVPNWEEYNLDTNPTNHSASLIVSGGYNGGSNMPHQIGFRLGGPQTSRKVRYGLQRTPADARLGEGALIWTNICSHKPSYDGEIVELIDTNTPHCAQGKGVFYRVTARREGED